LEFTQLTNDIVCRSFLDGAQTQVETRTPGLLRTKWCTEHESYNTYMLANKKNMHWTTRNSKWAMW